MRSNHQIGLWPFRSRFFCSFIICRAQYLTNYHSGWGSIAAHWATLIWLRTLGPHRRAFSFHIFCGHFTIYQKINDKGSQRGNDLMPRYPLYSFMHDDQNWKIRWRCFERRSPWQIQGWTTPRRNPNAATQAHSRLKHYSGHISNSTIKSSCVFEFWASRFIENPKGSAVFRYLYHKSCVR